MRRIGKKLFALVLSLCFVLPVAACGTKDKIVADGKTVNVRVIEAGYGTEWLYALKDKFEAAYADEGYKINILTPSNSVATTVVINELYNGDSGVDLYFPGSVWVTQVTEEGEYKKNLVEDLTESVYDQKAIGFDGREEEKTVREKMKKGVANDYNVYFKGREFAVPWADGPFGLTVNKRRLDFFGFDYPRTTNEMFEIFDSVMLGKNAKGENVGGPLKTGIYPHTFVSGNSGYPCYMYFTWLAQGLGYEKYKEFMTYGTADDSEAYKENGYELYADEAIRDMLEVVYRMFDKTYATLGSTSQNADTANLKMVDPDNGAIFFSNGNYMINEVKSKFPENAKDLRIINYPVISSVGKKAFGAGTTANITDEKKCDEILSATVKMVDEEKTDAQIVAALAGADYGVTVTENDVNIVRDARNIYMNGCSGMGAYVAKDSPVKDIAALFLRMYASDDNADLFFEKVGCGTVFDSKTEKQSDYAFSSDAVSYANKASAQAISYMGDCSGLRRKLGHGVNIIFGNAYLAPMVSSGSVSKWVKSGNNYVINGTDQVYYAAADTVFQNNKSNVQKNWASYISNLK